MAKIFARVRSPWSALFCEFYKNKLFQKSLFNTRKFVLITFCSEINGMLNIPSVFEYFLVYRQNELTEENIRKSTSSSALLFKQPSKFTSIAIAFYCLTGCIREGLLWVFTFLFSTDESSFRDELFGERNCRRQNSICLFAEATRAW